MSRFSPEELAYMQSHIHEDRGPRNIAVYSFLMVLAITAVALRFMARYFSKAGLWWDDYMSAFGMVTACVFAGAAMAQSMNGEGRHIIAISNEEFARMDKWLYAEQSLYPVTLAATKISILLLYWRLFPTRAFRVLVGLVGAVVTAWFVEVFFVTIFQCTPVSKFWDKAQPGTCLDLRGAFSKINAVPNIGVDVVLLIMPIRMVYGLHLGLKDKITVSGVFALGGFVVVASCIRFYYLMTTNFTGDVTWNIGTFHIWTVVEPCIAVVCACLPTMRSILLWSKRQLSSRVKSLRSSDSESAYKVTDTY